MENPLVSICCVAYNQNKFIAETIEGFLKQKVEFEFEIVIHDDASTDGTTEIIREYESKYPSIIKPIYQKENQWSKGIKPSAKYLWPKAKGKYIALCEGDDHWTDPYKLQTQVDFLEKNSDYVLTHHDANIIDGQGVVIKEGKLLEKNRRDLSEVELKKGPFILTLSLMFRNVVANMPAEFYEVHNGDKFLISYLGQYGKGKYLGHIGPAMYRVHGGGIWSSIDKIGKTKALIKTYIVLANYYLKLHDNDMVIFYGQRKILALRSLISKYIDVSDFQNAYNSFKEASKDLGKLKWVTVNFIFVIKMLMKSLNRLAVGK